MCIYYLYPPTHPHTHTPTCKQKLRTIVAGCVFDFACDHVLVYFTITSAQTDSVEVYEMRCLYRCRYRCY